MRELKILSRVGILGGLLLVTNGPVFGHNSPGAKQVKFAPEVPLLDCDGTPCVEARIGNGNPVRLGIDTGNVDSVVEREGCGGSGVEAVRTARNLAVTVSSAYS